MDCEFYYIIAEHKAGGKVGLGKYGWTVIGLSDNYHKLEQYPNYAAANAAIETIRQNLSDLEQIRPSTICIDKGHKHSRPYWIEARTFAGSQESQRVFFCIDDTWSININDAWVMTDLQALVRVLYGILGTFKNPSIDPKSIKLNSGVD